jgi:hypothetical protein
MLLPEVAKLDADVLWLGRRSQAQVVELGGRELQQISELVEIVGRHELWGARPRHERRVDMAQLSDRAVLITIEIDVSTGDELLLHWGFPS